jgi:RluA family pseudouridine synthase
MPEETTLQSKVPQNQSGQSLLDFLSARFRYQNRDAWQILVGEGKVTVNGSPASPQQILKAKDLVAYTVVLNEPSVDKNIGILHEEKTFLVAVKPGNLPSHADGNFIKNTLIYILNERLKDRGFKGKLNLVHRLDRETSGLMVVSKDRTASQNLTQQFESGTVSKEYLAMAKGVIKENEFQVEGFIGLDLQSQVAIRRKVFPEGEPHSKISSTRFEKIKQFQTSTLLRCVPKTGRTSQIRVHLDSIGHPLIGDKLYGRSDEEFLDYVRHVKAGGDPAWAGRLETPRHMLHAWRLGFQHPVTGQKMLFEAPIPDDFQKYLDTQGEPG